MSAQPGSLLEVSASTSSSFFLVSSLLRGLDIVVVEGLGCTHYPYRFPHELIASTWAIIGKHAALEAAARLVVVVVVRGSLVTIVLVLGVQLTDVLSIVVVLGSGTPVLVAAMASCACAPGNGKASRGNSGLAVQSPVRVIKATIRTEALIWGRMFVFGL